MRLLRGRISRVSSSTRSPGRSTAQSAGLRIAYGRCQRRWWTLIRRRRGSRRSPDRRSRARIRPTIEVDRRDARTPEQDDELVLAPARIGLADRLDGPQLVDRPGRPPPPAWSGAMVLEALEVGSRSNRRASGTPSGGRPRSGGRSGSRSRHGGDASRASPAVAERRATGPVPPRGQRPRPPSRSDDCGRSCPGDARADR